MLPMHCLRRADAASFPLGVPASSSAFGISHREGCIPTAKCSHYLFIRDVTKKGEEQSLGRLHRFAFTAV